MISVTKTKERYPQKRLTPVEYILFFCPIVRAYQLIQSYITDSLGEYFRMGVPLLVFDFDHTITDLNTGKEKENLKLIID